MGRWDCAIVSKNSGFRISQILSSSIFEFGGKLALIENKSATQYSAIADTDNTASIGIMRNLGMQFIKPDLHKDPLGDIEVDYYSLNV